MEYIKCSGYIEMADANNMIVLFPQVKQSRVDTITLFQCWDLHGYTGPLYGNCLSYNYSLTYLNTTSNYIFPISLCFSNETWITKSSGV